MWQSHFHRCINGNGIAVRGRSHGFDIPLPSRAINLPGVAANVVDIQDSKCEGRVNVTGEGSVSKRTMRYPSGRLGLPRDEGKRRGLPGTDLVRARANRNGWPKGLPYERLLDMFHDRSSRRSRHSHLPTYDKKRGGSRLPPQIHLAFSPLSRWNKTDISPLNGARGGTTKRDLVVLKFARVPAPFFAILKQPM